MVSGESLEPGSVLKTLNSEDAGTSFYTPAATSTKAQRAGTFLEGATGDILQCTVICGEYGDYQGQIGVSNGKWVLLHDPDAVCQSLKTITDKVNDAFNAAVLEEEAAGNPPTGAEMAYLL